MVQYYGRKIPQQVDIDYSRKSGPLTHIHQGVVEETARLENGGPGLPGEKLSAPPGGPGKALPAPAAAPPPAGGTAAPPEPSGGEDSPAPPPDAPDLGDQP